MALFLSPVLGLFTFFAFPVAPAGGAEHAFRGGLTIIVLGLVWALMLRTRLVLTADEISQVAFGTPRRRVAVAQVAKVLRARLVVFGEGGARSWLFLVDRDGRRRLAIREETYDDAELEHLLERLGQRVVNLGGEVTAKELERRRPGLVPWHLRHPIMVAVIGTFAIAVLAAALVISLAG